MLSEHGMKRMFTSALVVTLVTLTARVPSAQAAKVCPALLLQELARQLVPPPTRYWQGELLPSTPLPQSRPDTTPWGIDATQRDRAVESFLRHFGEDELCGIFLVGTRPRPEADASFVALVRSNRSHREETDLVRADLHEIL